MASREMRMERGRIPVERVSSKESRAVARSRLRLATTGRRQHRSRGNTPWRKARERRRSKSGDLGKGMTAVQQTVTKKPRPQNLRTGQPARLLHGGKPCPDAGRLVAAGAAGGGGLALVLCDYRGLLIGHGEREDVVGCFDLAKELLVANLAEGNRWFEFASWAHFAGEHQHAGVIFIAEDLKFRGVEVVRAVDGVPARGKCCSCHYKVVR